MTEVIRPMLFPLFINLDETSFEKKLYMVWKYANFKKESLYYSIMTQYLNGFSEKGLHCSFILLIAKTYCKQGHSDLVKVN